MGESAVLLRSFSHPSDASREVREGDPIHALTQSISFGRFMSESLAWEKWSTFSHNRYLEEVEKFSKPGSVAEKKAYFEAHYKKKAGMKAAEVEETNAAANDAPELKGTSEIEDNSSTDTVLAKENSQMVFIEQKEQNMADTCSDCHMDTWSADMISQPFSCNELQNTSELEDNSPTDTVLAKENSQMVFIEQKEQNMADTCSDCHMDTWSADMISQVVTDQQLKNNNASTEVVLVDANASYNNTIDDLADDARKRGETVAEYPVNEEKRTESDNLRQLHNPDIHNVIEATSLERMPQKGAVYQENSASSSKKKLASCSSKPSSQSGVSKLTSCPTKQANSLPERNLNNVATNSKEAARDSNGSKRVVPKSLHKSISFSAHISETSKASLKKPKDGSTPIRTPIRASVNGIAKHFSKLFLAEDKRSRALVNKSVSGGITKPGRLQSPSTEVLKSSSSNGSETRPPCISSPFSFRSEERVAKRKEFFQKLEEKNNPKEVEKALLETRPKDKAEHDIKKLRQNTKQNESLYHGSHLPNSHMKKEKVEQDIKKLRQSTVFKATPNATPCHSPPSLTNQMKKKPICRPCSPKLGGKLKQPTPSIILDTSSRPPKRPFVNTESSKSTTCSATSLPKFRRPTSNTVQDAHARPPWRSSMNSSSFKHVIEKNNGSTNRSVASLPKKNAHENASPNIQH